MRGIAEAFRPKNKKDGITEKARTRELDKELEGLLPPAPVERRTRMTHESTSAPPGFPSNTGLCQTDPDFPSNGGLFIDSPAWRRR